MAETADAIIIGAGVHGASLAFHLAERGLKPVVVEQRFLGSGATGRSSGLVRMHYDLEPESRLAWASFQYFRDWRERVGGDCGFVRTGFIQIVLPAFSDKLRANVAMHQRIGIPSLVITPDDVKRLAPVFSIEDFDTAAYEPESGYADPSATTREFMVAATRAGARLVQDCQVTAVEVSGGAVRGVATTRGAFSAPVVVNAAGPWAGEIGQLAGVDLPIRTWRHDTMFVILPPGLNPHYPAVIDDPNRMYFRPETGGLALVGLEDNNQLDVPLDDNLDRALPGFVETAVERICNRIPAMEGASLHSAHGGLDGFTPDQRAVLGPAGPEGFYLACGFSGTGFKIGPAVGACLSELILDGEATMVDITPFSAERFAEGRLLEGEHAYENLWK